MAARASLRFSEPREKGETGEERAMRRYGKGGAGEGRDGRTVCVLAFLVAFGA